MDPRLRRLLGGPELAWLVTRVRRRLERREPITGTVGLTTATAAQRDALERLLGRRPRSATGISVRLEELDEVLRSSGAHPDGLAAAVVALTGPVTDRVLAAAEHEAAWDAAFAPLERAVAGRPELASWAAGVRANGTIRRLAPEPGAAAALLTSFAAVLEALPAEPEPFGRFAERVLGSAHALDPDRPLAGLVIGAVQVLGGVPPGEGALWRREVWASVGLLRDELSSTVLTLGLPGDTSPAGRMLAALAAAGEPAVLTLRQLRDPPEWQLKGITVSVCENPVVVGEAADRLGAAAGPLVCIGGQPGAAAMTVLRAAVAAGASLRYHGDFDWGGLRIGNVLFARLPCVPWRFDTDAYLAAASRATGRQLGGAGVSCSWDPSLTATMREHGRAVEEERVIENLLDDLGQG